MPLCISLKYEASLSLPNDHLSQGKSLLWKPGLSTELTKCCWSLICCPYALLMIHSASVLLDMTELYQVAILIAYNSFVRYLNYNILKACFLTIRLTAKIFSPKMIWLNDNRLNSRCMHYCSDCTLYMPDVLGGSECLSYHRKPVILKLTTSEVCI